MPVVTVERKILKKNDEFAAENRKIFNEKKNAIGSEVAAPRGERNGEIVSYSGV